MHRAPRFALAAVLASAVLAAPEGAPAQVTPDGDALRGAEIFASLCISCHRENARGDDRAPDIRGATAPAIRRATSGMDSMPDFGLDPRARADIRAYLATLAD